MRSPHVPISHDGSDDQATRYEQIDWLMRTGYSREASMARRLILHDLAIKCTGLFDLLERDPCLALKREKAIRLRLESL